MIDYKRKYETLVKRLEEAKTQDDIDTAVIVSEVLGNDDVRITEEELQEIQRDEDIRRSIDLANYARNIRKTSK